MAYSLQFFSTCDNWKTKAGWEVEGRRQNRRAGWWEARANVCIRERDFYTTFIRQECLIIYCLLFVYWIVMNMTGFVCSLFLKTVTPLVLHYNRPLVSYSQST